jgi:hypothetical protein
MDNTREKLIELLETVVSQKELLCAGEVLVSTSRVADHLISHGVTFATDNKWIPASEPPKDHKEYIVMIKGAKCPTTLWYRPSQKNWCEAGGDKPHIVTHWMYLPEPPKEG